VNFRKWKEKGGGEGKSAPTPFVGSQQGRVGRGNWGKDKNRAERGEREREGGNKGECVHNSIKSSGAKGNKKYENALLTWRQEKKKGER